MRYYTPRDSVFKGNSPDEAIRALGEEVLVEDGERGIAALSEAFDRVNREGMPQSAGSYLVHKENDSWIVIVPGRYDLFNCVAALFDILVEPVLDLKKSLEESERAISDYLGVIEGQEQATFGDERELLFQLSRELKETLSLIQEEEFSESELERLSDQIEKKYYAGIADCLNSIIVTCR